MHDFFQNNFMIYFVPMLLAFLCVLYLTPLIKKYALSHNIVDKPNDTRKVHNSPIPLLGGWAVLISFVLIVSLAWYFDLLTDTRITDSHIFAVIIGSIIIGIGGFLDDKYNLKPIQQFFWPLLAAFVVVLMGVKIGYITNPFESGSGPYGRSLVYFVPTMGSIFSFFWLLGMMYTIKFLDGLDGLVTGIGAIGATILFIVSLFWDVPLSGTSILALILAGSLLGFLKFNWHPAKIFLGESSLFIGFMLGVLSIISGAKIATTLLVVGIPILDVVWVILRRVFKEKRSPFKADRKHLHHRLFDIGLSHRQVVLLYYLITVLFGVSSIFLQSQQKVIALLVLIVFMIGLGIIVLRKGNKQINKL